MSYTVEDVDRAERAIREAAPDARIERGHYGFGLAVAHPTKRAAWIVFQPERSDAGLEEIRPGPDEIARIIRELQAP